MYSDIPGKDIVKSIPSLDFAYIFLSEVFPSSPYFSKYCHCSPQCERTSYDITMSTAEISEYTIQLKTLQINDDPYLAEIRTIQDWTLLFNRNRLYTQKLRNLEYLIQYVSFFIFAPDYYEYSKILMAVNLFNNSNIYNGTIPYFAQSFEIIANINSQLIKMQTWLVNSRFIKISTYNIEDFKARAAHDIIRNLGNMQLFLENLISSFTDIMEDTEQLLLSLNNSCTFGEWCIPQHSLFVYAEYFNNNITLNKKLLMDAQTMHEELCHMVQSDTKLQRIEPWKGGTKDKEYFR